MIGNIITTKNMYELQTLIQLKGQYIQGYINACQEKGINIQPHKTKIVVVNDTDCSGDDYIVGSILLPGSKAMFNLVEGDYNGFLYEYYNKLDNDPDIREYIAVLLAGLLERDFDYILHFDIDDDAMFNPICKALTDYMYSRYGVVCYRFTDVMCNYNLFNSQSIVPEAVVGVQNIVNNYKLSNRPTQLFVQY